MSLFEPVDISPQYTKKILVENVAVVERNVVQEQKGSLYLRIKPREKLDVIDIGEDNLIICRNKEGKCK